MIICNIVYLSYGQESEYRRAIFSVLSLLAWHEKLIDGIRILIYTDNQDFFIAHLGHIDIEYIYLDDNLLQEMVGIDDFVHRRKVAVVDMTFKLYPTLNLLFIDSDTFFYTDASAVISGFRYGESFMHKREYTLEKGLLEFSKFDQERYPKDFINYISGRQFVIDGIEEEFTKNDYSWNSGVIGLTPNLKLYMPDFYSLTDQFYHHSKWFISEQLAFSLLLQRKTKIMPTDKYILHYWGKRQKNLMDSFLNDLFYQKLVNEIAASEYIRNLSKYWKKRIHLDYLLEQATIAFSDHSWYYGTKKSVQILWNLPTAIDMLIKRKKRNQKFSP